MKFAALSGDVPRGIPGESTMGRTQFRYLVMHLPRRKNAADSKPRESVLMRTLKPLLQGAKSAKKSADPSRAMHALSPVPGRRALAREAMPPPEAVATLARAMQRT